MGEAAVAISVLVTIAFIYLILIGLGLTSYIITSLSLYTIAKRRQISNPWLAWLPFANNWIMGAIVDHHDGQMGVKRNWRVILLVLSAAFWIGYIFACIILFVSVFAMRLQFTASEPQAGQILGVVVPFYIIFILAVIIGTAFEFCQVICIYKIYEVTNPNKAIKYILLSLLVPLASAICLMKCKDSLYGIPKPLFTAETAPKANTSYPVEQSIDENFNG